MAQLKNCPVCNLPDPTEGENGWYGEICACCGTEYGYDDDEVSHNELRIKWINNGLQWWSRARPAPVGWNVGRQLDGLISKQS